MVQELLCYLLPLIQLTDQSRLLPINGLFHFDNNKNKKNSTNYSLKNINVRNGSDKRVMERLKIAVESKAANMKVG